VSGVLIDAERVLTASHLVGEEGISIILPDGGKASARVLGRDPFHDLAVLRLSSRTAPPKLAHAAVEVGDLVVSLRRDPFDGINASLAMVSAAGARLSLGRAGVVERYLQTDAGRMMGSTGGPLVDADGALAGVQVFNSRMGAEIAIPADLALARARVLEEKGSIKRPYLGIRSQSVALPSAARDVVKGRQDEGLLLVMVDSGSAAEKAGLRVGDIVVGFAGEPVGDHKSLLALMAAQGAGASVEIEVVRGDALHSLPLAIGSA
jgi:S1-C subfamily serine protease